MLNKIIHYISFVSLFAPIPVLLLKILALPFKFFWGFSTLYILLGIYLLSIFVYNYFYYSFFILGAFLFSSIYLRFASRLYSICYYFYKIFDSYIKTFFIMFAWWSFIYGFYSYKKTLISLGEEVPLSLFLIYYSLFVIGYIFFIILRFLKDKDFFFDTVTGKYEEPIHGPMTLYCINIYLLSAFIHLEEKHCFKIFKKYIIYYIFELHIQHKFFFKELVEYRFESGTSSCFTIEELINEVNKDFFLKNDPMFLEQKELKENTNSKFKNSRFYLFSVTDLDAYVKAQNYRLISTISFSLSLILFLYN